MSVDLITIGISGCSNSGKTTLMFLLTELLSPYFVLQQDDFHRHKIPLREDGIQDNSCPEAFDMDAFKRAIRTCKAAGPPPDGTVSWQKPADLSKARSKALAQFHPLQLDNVKRKLLSATHGRKIGIVEGSFLLQDPEVVAMLDAKLLLRTSKARAKSRRMKRFARSEPGDSDARKSEEYFEKCLWPSTSSYPDISILFEECLDIMRIILGDAVMR
jgi:nicotinamide/nicotinate riboside kinase